MVELRALNEIAFCKRTFIHDPLVGHVVGPLDLKAMYASLDYFKVGQSRSDQVQHIDWFLMELALHGRNTFDLHVKKLKKVCDQYGYKPTTYNFNLLRKQLGQIDFAM
jgi:hypothetical protein